MFPSFSLICQNSLCKYSQMYIGCGVWFQPCSHSHKIHKRVRENISILWLCACVHCQIFNFLIRISDVFFLRQFIPALKNYHRNFMNIGIDFLSLTQQSDLLINWLINNRNWIHTRFVRYYLQYYIPPYRRQISIFENKVLIKNKNIYWKQNECLENIISWINWEREAYY